MRLDKDDPRLMDYVLGELEDGEARDVAAALEEEINKDARDVVEELRGVTETTRRILSEDDAGTALSDEQRAAIVGQVEEMPKNVVQLKKSRPFIPGYIAAAAVLVILAAISIPNTQRYISRDNFLAAVSAPETEPPPADESLQRRYIEPEHMLPQEHSPAVRNRNSEQPQAFVTPAPEDSFTEFGIAKNTPETMNEERVRKHMEYGELYREQGLNAQAAEIYSHVLELDPDNEAAKEGLRQAGDASSRNGVAQDSDRINTYIEKSYQLPAVTDAKGANQYVFRVPETQAEPAPASDSDGDGLRSLGTESQAGRPQIRLGVKADFTDDVSQYIEYDVNGDQVTAGVPVSTEQAAPPAEIVEARNRLDIKANLKDGLSLTYENGTDEGKKNTAVTPEEEQWAEYNVGNLTGQSEITPLASNIPEDAVRPERQPEPPLWQWNMPDTKPTEIVGGPGTETYVKVAGVKPFSAVKDEPLSTFSIDVDTAAYSNVRRFLNQGQLPPPDAVRIEEMINYFAYAYPQPTDGRPFAVAVHGAPAPWAPQHRLVRIGVKGKEVPRTERPPANLVFLLDVSGSMGDANKLPLVKESMKTLLGQLNANDRVGIVTYAGNARKVLDPTPCSEASVIARAIDSLQAGGSTNGGGGIQMAYDMADAHFNREGINRVIVATDGDFNVGTTSHGGLMGLIEARAKSGVFLTTLGFGMGNLKDSTLEQLADRGNGNYAYIDNHAEARRALVDQLAGTLQTIAKDVKIQVEFNPALVSHYRLLGYENRALANRDFNDDTKDAGEIGAGHTVTALYEIIPTGRNLPPGVEPLQYRSTSPGVDPLKYGNSGVTAEEDRIAPIPEPTGEWLTVKMRYKEPQGNESTKIETPLTAMNNDLRETDADFRFAAAVSAFGQVLRNTGYRHPSNFDRIIELARGAANNNVDREGFIDMVITAKTLSGPR